MRIRKDRPPKLERPIGAVAVAPDMTNGGKQMNVQIPTMLYGVGVAAVIAAAAYVAMRMRGKRRDEARIDAILLFALIGGGWATFALVVLPKI